MLEEEARSLPVSAFSTVRKISALCNTMDRFRGLLQSPHVASHDLQEPLRMIANYTQLLADKYKGKLDEQADKFIGYSVDGAIRLQALIQDLLRLSRLGKGKIDLTTTESSDVVEKAMQNLRAAIEESGAVANCRDLPRVMADRSQLIQIFQNLIANAIKFRGSNTPDHPD
jgi:chemotaxis family two-component system sensor kinase Cph1